jgi:ribosomal protein S27E
METIQVKGITLLFQAWNPSKVVARVRCGVCRCEQTAFLLNYHKQMLKRSVACVKCRAAIILPDGLITIYQGVSRGGNEQRLQYEIHPGP